MEERLNFLSDKQLLAFLHRNKTELSCMELPQAFVSQLRDHDLVSTEQHGKINRMKSIEQIRRAVYNVLEYIETQRPDCIHHFWKCVFKKTILNKYPTLQQLHNSLFNGEDFYDCEGSLPGARDIQREEIQRKEPEISLQVKKCSLKKRKRTRKTTDDGVDDDDDKQPSASEGPVTPRRLYQRPKKVSFTSPLKKGEKGDIWTWDIYKVQLPVTCGDLKGTLNRNRLAQGEKCIVVEKLWYSPTEFEQLAGKGQNKNWKKSIHCMNTTLGQLLEEGHLKCNGYKKVKKILFPPREAAAGSAESDVCGKDSSSEQRVDGQLRSFTAGNAPKVLRVVCRDISGLLHSKRFASGTCGRCIRTSSSWKTPVDFAKEASSQKDFSWKKQITYEGRPLGELLQEKVLESHSLLCKCSLCDPDGADQDSQRNDDECWNCRREATVEEVMVACDQCPRSFHQKCHLPHIPDSMLNDGRPWICTPCVWIQTRDLFSEIEEMEAVMSSSTARHMLHCQQLLLSLYRADEDRIFTSDPSHLPEYTRVILTPMWLDQVADKLQSHEYQTVGHFVSDIQLIFSNCASYNRDNPEFLSMGTKLKEHFENELNTMFTIQQDTSESEILLYAPQWEISLATDEQLTN